MKKFISHISRDAEARKVKRGVVVSMVYLELMVRVGPLVQLYR